MNMPGMPNKMPNMGMMPAQTGGPMNHMSQLQTMQNNPMLTQINQMAQGNIPQQINQMVPGQMNQLTTGQMQQTMQVHLYYIFLLFLIVQVNDNSTFVLYTYLSNIPNIVRMYND